MVKDGVLADVVETLSSSVTPQDIESSRIIVNFMCKLKIPNELLFKWLTTQQVYQKASDILLVYIAKNWSRD